MVFIEEVVETPPPTPPRQKRSSSSSSSSKSRPQSLLNERRFGSHEWSEEVALACDNYRSPFVLWAQDADHILLKVDVQDALNPRIKIGEHSVDVLTEATGASGVSIYRSHIDLLHNVCEKVRGGLGKDLVILWVPIVKFCSSRLFPVLMLIAFFSLLFGYLLNGTVKTKNTTFELFYVCRSLRSWCSPTTSTLNWPSSRKTIGKSILTLGKYLRRESLQVLPRLAPGFAALWDPSTRELLGLKGYGCE